MARTEVLFPILAITIAVLPAISLSSLSPWYCQRLVPLSITSAVTPCTFPCLFISPYEHPHIVVHPELDGTDCKMGAGVHQKTQIGKCRSGVCTQEAGTKVLKRKKRFICLLTVAQLIRARKERRKLRNELEQLKTLTRLNNYARGNRLGGPGVGSGSLPGGPVHGVTRQDENSGNPRPIEIHIIAPGSNGAAVPGSSVIRPEPFIPESILTNTARDINGVRGSYVTDRAGHAGGVGTNLPSVNNDATINTRTTSGVGGTGESITGIGEVAISGYESNGAGGRLGGISTETAGIVGSGGGGRGIGLRNPFIGATARNGFSGGRRDATLGGDAGLGREYGGSGIGEHRHRASLHASSGMGVGIGARGGTSARFGTRRNVRPGTESSRGVSLPENVGFGSTRGTDDDPLTPRGENDGFSGGGDNFGGVE